MPIKIPDALPAIDVLRAEGVMVMSSETALRQDIRPLQIGLVNLMPNKERTETQFARLIGATPLQIELTLIRMTDHVSKNTTPAHLEAFYTTFAEARARRFDGLIVTGAPVERLPFEAVGYWGELTELFDWTQTNVTGTFAICWGAQAMLHHFHGVPKHALARKAFGCFRHRNLAPGSPYLRGVSDDIVVPVSRWTEVRAADVPPGLRMLLCSPETGPCLIEDAGRRALYMFNHLEYDTTSLDEEYRRDVAAGQAIAPPAHYYPGDDPAQAPENRWRSHAHLLFGNWLNELYQATPFDWT
ncbi:MAG: homoserine O-succinyltransferase [Rhodobacteraceae bacterium]|nr:MAG: homoserine O-succinyltransferase [Paracoccaceae bacterium]